MAPIAREWGEGGGVGKKNTSGISIAVNTRADKQLNFYEQV